jgi:hypothetical protein
MGAIRRVSIGVVVACGKFRIIALARQCCSKGAICGVSSVDAGRRKFEIGGLARHNPLMGAICRALVGNVVSRGRFRITALARQCGFSEATYRVKSTDGGRRRFEIAGLARQNAQAVRRVNRVSGPSEVSREFRLRALKECNDSFRNALGASPKKSTDGPEDAHALSSLLAATSPIPGLDQEYAQWVHDGDLCFVANRFDISV